MNAAGNHRKNLVRSVEASLDRLRTDHLDVLWVHARDNFTPVEEVMRALDDVVRSGKVLYVGVSDWPAWEIAQANTLAELRGWTAFAGSQLRYNLLERTPERELLPQARAFDLAVLAWAPLAAGRLTGKYRRGETGRLDVVGEDGRRDHHAEETVTAVLEIAEQGGWSPAQVALAWLRSRPGNIIPIIAATKESQLLDNLGRRRRHAGRRRAGAARPVQRGAAGLPARLPAGAGHHRERLRRPLGRDRGPALHLPPYGERDPLTRTSPPRTAPRRRPGGRLPGTPNAAARMAGRRRLRSSEVGVARAGRTGRTEGDGRPMRKIARTSVAAATAALSAADLAASTRT